MKDYPTSKVDWWEFVKKYEQQLLDIIDMFAPEKMEEAEQFIGEKNPELARILNLAWWNAPDDRSIHDIPGWSVLCNLCSEEYVLYEE